MAVALKLDPSKRMFIVGATGSGKTVLAKHLLQPFYDRKWRIVIVDPKRYWMGKHPVWPTKGPGTIDAPRLVTRFDPKLRVQCYQPDVPAWSDPGFWHLVDDLLEAGDTIVYFDEIEGVADSSHHQPITRLWTQGRALQVAGYAGSQRPSNIPEPIKSQAETWIVLTVRGKRDRETITEYTGQPQMAEKPLPKHHYWLWQTEDGVAQHMRPIPYKGK